MNIFVSWSGDRSRELARELVTWLRSVNHFFRPWMSEGLGKGVGWFEAIGNKLADSRCGIVCVTPENTESGWLLFEAGALSALERRFKVYPLLYGMSPDDLDGPLAQFHATIFSKEDIYGLVRSLNDELGEDRLEEGLLSATFAKFWPDLEQKANEISKIRIESASLAPVLDALHSHGFEVPTIGRVACFNDGFESHALYESVFKLARERIYIFGRKNRKVFDKEHADFFRALPPRVAGGFDFRCLFLDPSAPRHVLAEAHDSSDFDGQLMNGLKQGAAVLRDVGIDADRVCRLYSRHRTTALVVMDNIVLFTPIDFGLSGKARAVCQS